MEAYSVPSFLKNSRIKQPFQILFANPPKKESSPLRKIPKIPCL
ncbi:hypothetical protein HPHPP3_1077 [Helicobacter pylori Hp P-3]|uniref:Uncharacterized protein n=2 Tax=Helicobacter pylori TaxID=210 RepID=I9VWQ6_HELPX|nr:hypothetical protein HPHPH34_1335 [Helicobacter pylori Hp H-34]EJC01676.1 hypothetical protein HPHPP3_1077 [Helicobacter pylori Hp P-3]EJC20383.1 hypothetical protein HPHPP1B_1205 [Helicobacter pylori Hp P-1b]EMR58770.1 hypothetical protein HPHPH1_0925 [Helicobacter pylori Hp H-1]